MPDLRDRMRSLYRRSPLYGRVAPILEGRRQLADLERWARHGAPHGPAPHLVKQGIVRAARDAVGARILVETGTFLGEMVHAMRGHFDQVISIEVDPALHALARHRFRGAPDVVLHLGDSGQIMSDALAKVDRPIVFWLDGHYSGGETGTGKSHCPVREELEVILARSQRDAILIDDADAFGVDPAYPSVAEVAAIVAARRAGYEVGVRQNVIEVLPRTAR